MLISWGTKIMECALSAYPPLVRLYKCYYRSIVEDEIKIARITDKDRVLCIGGGSVPCTAMQIAKFTGAKVKVIDIDEVAVKRARVVVEQFGLGDFVIVEQASGEIVDLDGITVVHLAVQISPKNLVIDHVWRNAAPSTRVIVRVPQDALRSYYCNASELTMPFEFHQYGNKFRNVKGTMLLVKPASANAPALSVS
ncbi:MAG: hypothetical protein GX020_06325 [Firmicutes bacterium]|nr:hypothetical protein [Bacillota bacterium]